MTSGSMPALQMPTSFIKGLMPNSLALSSDMMTTALAPSLMLEALAAVTGVPDALFCHKGLWLVTAKTREGIMELAKIALSM
jgi:uncharacterized UPF0160 family protein